jgi:hypothetical protein
MIPIDVGSTTVVRVANDETAGTTRRTFWIARFLISATKDCRLFNDSLLNFNCLSFQFKLRLQKRASSFTLLFKRALDRLARQDSGSILKYRKTREENQIQGSKSSKDPSFQEPKTTARRNPTSS